MKSILGRKVGMTQVFTVDGKVVPVTVIEVLPNIVLQKKTKEKDGYDALQVGYEDKRASLQNKPEEGITKKAKTAPKKFTRELKGDEMANYNVGDAIKVDIFQTGDAIDVTGKTKGKGFTGVIKAYGFQRGPSAHGSGYHRALGSLCTDGIWNNRIHPGRKMAGHFGYTTKTVLNLCVVKVDVENNLMLVKGPVPGANKSLVYIRSAIKAQKGKQSFELVDYSEKVEAPKAEKVEAPKAEEVAAEAPKAEETK